MTALENDIGDPLHFGGAVGSLDKLGDKGVRRLRGDWRQSSACGRWCAPAIRERDGQAMLANWLSMVTGSLGKMGQDIALLAQTEVGEIKLAAGGGSSAMPHKVNFPSVPRCWSRWRASMRRLRFPPCTSHSFTRGSAPELAWTLEWMILPQMAVATAAALRTAGDLIEGMEFVGAAEPR